MRPVVPTEGNRGRKSRHVTTSPPSVFGVTEQALGGAGSHIAMQGGVNTVMALGSKKIQHKPTMGDYTLVVTSAITQSEEKIMDSETDATENLGSSRGYVASDFVGKRVIHVCDSPVAFVQSKWTYVTDRREVILMAVSKSWAMVRRPKAVPYVCQVKELEFPSA